LLAVRVLRFLSLSRFLLLLLPLLLLPLLLLLLLLRFPPLSSTIAPCPCRAAAGNVPPPLPYDWC
jgi:hypothetical protein